MAVTELTDAELLDRARDGDEAAFTALYVRHHAAIHRLAASYRSDEPDDLVDATFAQVVAELRRRTGPTEAFRAYLFAVLHLRMAEQPERARRALPTVPAPVAAVASSPALGGNDRVMTTRAYESLPPHWQVALWHTTVLGCEPDELAGALEMPADAAPALARYAARKLRQAYLDAHLEASPRPSCEPHRQRLTAHLRGSLDPAGDEAAREHLDKCASCRDLVTALDGVDELLARSVAPFFPTGQGRSGVPMPLGAPGSAVVDTTGQSAVVVVGAGDAGAGDRGDRGVSLTDSGRWRLRTTGQSAVVGGAAVEPDGNGHGNGHGSDSGEPTTGSTGRVKWWPFGDRDGDGDAGDETVVDGPAAAYGPDGVPGPDSGPAPAFGTDGGVGRRTTGAYSAVSVFPTAAGARAARARATRAAVGANGPNGTDGAGGPGGPGHPLAPGEHDDLVGPAAGRWERARELAPTIGGVAAATLLIAGLAVLGTAATGGGDDDSPDPAIIDDIDTPDRQVDSERPPDETAAGRSTTSTTAPDDDTTTTTGEDEAGDELAAAGDDDRAVSSGAPSTGGGAQGDDDRPRPTNPTTTERPTPTTEPEPPPLASWQVGWSGGSGSGSLNLSVQSASGRPQPAPVVVSISLTSGVTVTDLGGCAGSGSSVTCTVPAPAPGESVSLSVGLSVEGDGQQASVSARQDGASLGSHVEPLTSTGTTSTMSTTPTEAA
jgi:DNA-directed RNA polymerase specialized sigma24 family protein